MDIPPVTHYRASEPVSCEAREVREHVYTDPLCKIGTNFGAGGVLSWYSIYIHFSRSRFSLRQPQPRAARGLTPASGGVRTQALQLAPRSPCYSEFTSYPPAILTKRKPGGRAVSR